MRRYPGEGLALCFGVNLLLHGEWGILAAVLWLPRLWISFPPWPSQTALGLWLLVSVAATALVRWSAGCASPEEAPRPNRNPYSASNAQMFPSLVPKAAAAGGEPSLTTDREECDHGAD